MQTPTTLRELYTAKAARCNAHQANAAIADCHETLALWRGQDTDYTRRLWAEIDAMRDRLHQLQRIAASRA